MQQHGETPLAGPLWLVAQLLVLVAIAAAAYVLVDSLRPARRASARDHLPEPLWLYTAAAGAFLVLTAAVQVVPGIQGAAAIIAIATPVLIVITVVYLLRVVFPRRPEESEHAR